MDISSNEILDVGDEGLKRKPICTWLSFGLGIISSLLFVYLIYGMMQNMFKEGGQQDLISMITSPSYLIGSSIATISYLVSLICLIISYLRKEKSALKIIVSVAHGFVLFSIAASLVVEAFK